MTRHLRQRQRQQRWARFLRLIVTCFAFLLVRPVAASSSSFDAIDRIVVVAGSQSRGPANGDIAKPRAKLSTHARRPATTHFAATPLALRASPRHDHTKPIATDARTDDGPPVYLRNCSLLC